MTTTTLRMVATLLVMAGITGLAVGFPPLPFGGPPPAVSGETRTPDTPAAVQEESHGIVESGEASAPDAIDAVADESLEGEYACDATGGCEAAAWSDEVADDCDDEGPCETAASADDAEGDCEAADSCEAAETSEDSEDVCATADSCEPAASAP